MDTRLENEIKHGKFLLQEGAGEIWNWESPAGKVRWKRRVQMLTSHLTSELKVLEIGCGTGYFTQEIVKTGAEITAIDISPDLIHEAQNTVSADNVKFIVENAYKMSFNSSIFDSVIGSSVLHHLDIDKALCEIFRVLKPDGSIFFTEPNMLNPQIFLEKNVPSIKRITGNSPDETAFFLWKIRGKLKKTGFTDIKVSTFDFLHPKIPKTFIPILEPLCNAAESVPLLKNIAGSLYICARKT